jgi:NAD+ kinase
MIPVAPHLSMDTPLVLPERAEVTLSPETHLPMTLSIDGHINLPLSGGDTLKIKRSSKITRFWRIRPQASFYNILEEKLRGKQGESRKG